MCYAAFHPGTHNLKCQKWITYLNAVYPQNHQITEWLKLEGTSRLHLVQSPYSEQVTKSTLPMTMFSWVLNISKSGDSTTSLGSLFQCLTTLTVKKVFLMFKFNFTYFSLCPLLLLLSLVTTERRLTSSPSFFSPVRYLYADFIQEADTVTKARTEADLHIPFHYITWKSYYINTAEG